MKTLRILVAGVTTMTSVLQAQSSGVSLGRPTGAVGQEFGKVISAHELSPGKLLVADERERKLVLVDFDANTARSIGRTGSGPGEFRSLGALVPRRGGGAFLVDFVQRRLLPVLPNGALADPVLMPESSLLIAAADTNGRLYANRMLFRNRVISDSMQILRWDVASDRVDTLLQFNAGRSGMIIPAGTKQRVWYSTTSWAPLADGTIVLLEAATYRLSRWSNGSATVVATLPFERRAVTAEDRNAWVDAQKEVKPVALGQQGAQPGPARPRPEPTFPTTFPAFEADTPLLLAPDGTLWVHRLQSPRDTLQMVDVIDLAGRLVGRVQLAAKSRIVAIGKNAIYVVEVDADDVQRVRRFAYPNLARR
jgi:hypothetical protein